MLLVIDSGNTNVVFAVRDGSAWRGILAHPHRPRSAPPTNTASG